jgi:uncharacterized protein (DUF4415 family)
MGTKVKQEPTSMHGPDRRLAEQALRAAADAPVDDPENPPTSPEDWGHAVRSRSLPELRAALARQQPRPSSAGSEKVPTMIPFDADVLAGIKATGSGWQERVNDAVREWLDAH